MPKANFLCAIDQGTTGSTALIIDISTPSMPKIIGKSTVDYPQHYPKTSWVEHDLNDIWRSVNQAIEGATAGALQVDHNFRRNDISAIGITNQRETICVFDRRTGEPIHRAIVWQCKRSAQICERLKDEGYEAQTRQKTGLVLDPYFSGTKITWLMENDDRVARALRDKTALVGTIDAWLVYKLTGGKVFATEPSNASRTLAFNIHSGRWDLELMDALKIPSVDILPELKESAGFFGRTEGLRALPDGIPITGILGDQQAALAGQACFSAGLGKCTYGTGAFLLVNQGEKPIVSKNGLLTTVAWSLNGKLTYAFEGSAFIAGASIQFLRDQLGIIHSAGETEALATPVAAAPDIYFVPALAGLGAPEWDHKARGAFLGLTRGTTNAQIVRAALEGMAFQVCDLMAAIEADLSRPITVLKVDGGACANSLLLQIQADLANKSVERPRNLETTAFGAAMFAGLGVGIYQSLKDLETARHVERLFVPEAGGDSERSRREKLSGWKRAKQAIQVFAGSAEVRDHV